MYYNHGAKVHRDLFTSALRIVYKTPMLEVELPSAGRVSLMHQSSDNRYVAHLLYGAPIQRGRCQVIEDLPELRDLKVTFRLPKPIRTMNLVPDGGNLDFTVDGNEIHTVVPRFRAHCALVASYA